MQLKGRLKGSIAEDDPFSVLFQQTARTVARAVCLHAVIDDHRFPLGPQTGNFFRRIEVATPIFTPELKARVIHEGIEMALQDNTRAWLMQPDGSYTRAQPENGEPAFSLQESLWEMYGR